MPASLKPPKSIGRFTIGVNVLLQVLLGVFLFSVVNYLSWRTYKRWDLTDHGAHTLSETTIGYLKAMEKPARLVVLFTRGTQLSNNVYDMIDEYKRHAGNKLEIEYVDPVRQPDKLEDLKTRYQFDLTDRKDGIIVEVQGSDNKPRTKFVLEDDFAIVDAESRPPRLIAFIGETALTSALLAVSEEKKPVIKFVIGKGAMARGLGGETAATEFFADFASSQNAELGVLDLADSKADLKGADIIVLLNIGSDLTDDESYRLQEYWESKRGALLVMLNPDNRETPKLSAFLKNYGVLVQNDRVLSVKLTSRNQPVDWSVNCAFALDTVITKSLRGYTTEFSGKTQSLVLDKLREDELKSKGITGVELIHATDDFWGETKYEFFSETDVPQWDPDDDNRRGPTTAVAIELGSINDASLRIDSSRMVVVGNSTLLDPPAPKVHRDFVASSLNWMLDRDEMVGISPKIKRYYRLKINERQSERVFQIITLALPISVIFFGLFVWSLRRA